MNAPQNWPPQPGPPGPPGFGQAPQPGYGPPQPGGYGAQPPRKKRTGLIVGLAVGAVVLIVGGVFGVMYMNYTADVGGGPGDEPTEACAISDDLKKQAKVSSFRLAIPPDDGKSGLKHSLCMWEQTKGKDGRDTRTLGIHVYDYRVFSQKKDRNLEQAKSTYASQTAFPMPGDQAKPTDGLGDEALYVVPGPKTDLTDLTLVVRQGEVVYSVQYSGHDKGFFSDSEFPLADAEAVVRKAAEELTKR
ncbi:hypothetical protein ACQPZF_38475 [Actinosynnema sp. CS-041913]|uniref:hypothetical protein n=1 Tax=Actinosynnema sp. CS-041913 TaxID=3239917 RepID=UPI003D948B77